MNNFIFGVNGHNRNYRSYPEKNLEKQIKLAAGLGVTLYRVNFNPVTDNDYAYLDRIVALAKEHGMDIMLVADDMMLDASLDEVAARYTAVASHYDGIIPFIQIFNEVDVYCMVDAPAPGNGFTAINFNKTRLEQMTPRFIAAVNAVKAASKSIKTVINISYQHTYLFDYIAENGVEWDITGIDWYKNMYWKNPDENGYENILPRLCERYKQDIIVCETNIWPDNEGKAAEYQNDTEYLPVVGEYILKNYPRVKGMIAYELLDEVFFEAEGNKYNGESHFGLVLNSIDGEPVAEKPAYHAYKKFISEHK